MAAEPFVADDLVVGHELTKRFAGVIALHGVSVAIRRGEVHALVGENGAGKSTLGKIIAGVHRPDGGQLAVAGAAVRFDSPRAALDRGITLIAQELALVPERSVLDNVFLGREGGRMGFADRRGLRRRFDALVERSGLEADPAARVATLRVADQQKVEILRALAREAQVIVMDEPTAALTREEAQRLLAIIDRLRVGGTTVVYVSHFLEEVLQVADRVTILKDGHLVRTAQADDETPDSLVSGMLGRTLSIAFPDPVPAPADAPVVLRASALTRAPAVLDASLEVRAGEIVGIAGLVGSGRSELARLIFGADRPTSGTLELGGRAVRWRSPHDAIAAGVAMLPESRKDQGLVVDASVRDNVLLAHRGAVSRLGFVSRAREARTAQATVEAVGATADRLALPVDTLSGGNQQKIAVGKWLVRAPRLLIVDEPTRGVDVGAKRAIYDLLVRHAQEGMGILLISSDLEEVLGLAHRVLVMRRGRIAGELSAANATSEAVMALAFSTGAVS